MWKLISNPSASAYFVFSSWEPLGILISVMADYSLSRKKNTFTLSLWYENFGSLKVASLTCHIRTWLLLHSSEIRGLCLMKCFSENTSKYAIFLEYENPS